jgi:hypothetical protein
MSLECVALDFVFKDVRSLSFKFSIHQYIHNEFFLFTSQLCTFCKVEEKEWFASLYMSVRVRPPIYDGTSVLIDTTEKREGGTIHSMSL